MESDIGLNKVEFTGFVGRKIQTFESKEGTPGIRFNIFVGSGDKYGFWQTVAVFGNRAIELAEEINHRDLVFVSGKKTFMYFRRHNIDGLSSAVDTVVTIICYILRKHVKDENDEE